MKSQATGLRPSSVVKRRAILEAAEVAFLTGRYDTVTMDDIAAASGVSKQTVYAHFGTKELLFVELVTAMTRHAGDAVHDEQPLESGQDADVAEALVDLLDRQLSAVLQPRILRLRRVVIGEVSRFPQLARAVLENGPHRAIARLATLLEDLDARGLLSVADPRQAAIQLNWLVMGAPVNDAMFLGDTAVPSARARRTHVTAAVRTFLDAYPAVTRLSPEGCQG